VIEGLSERDLLSDVPQDPDMGVLYGFARIIEHILKALDSGPMCCHCDTALYWSSSTPSSVSWIWGGFVAIATRRVTALHRPLPRCVGFETDLSGLRHGSLLAFIDLFFGVLDLRPMCQDCDTVAGMKIREGKAWTAPEA
jgi:hypothetical protein